MKVHEFINLFAPTLIEHIKENPVKLKAGTSELFKKDKESLYNLFHREAARYGLQAWLSVSIHSGVSLHVKDSYAVSGDLTRQGYWGAQYYERLVYLSREPLNQFEPFPLYDLEEWRVKAALVGSMRDKIREMESQLREITYVTEGN